MRTARTISDDVGYYHVILKATGPQFLFREDADKATFQDILKRVSRFSSVQPLAYAFLDNHMHLLLKVPERESVPDDDFARRVAALYGPDRAAALFARWEKWRAQGREAEAERQRDGLLRRMFDLGQFMKILSQMLVCRVLAFGNGRAVGLMRQVAPLARRGGPQPIGRCGLFTATRVRSPLRLTA